MCRNEPCSKGCVLDRLMCIPPVRTSGRLDGIENSNLHTSVDVMRANEGKPAEMRSGARESFMDVQEMMEEGVALREFGRVVVMLILFVQKLGLMIPNPVDYDIWGDIFGWANVFSLSLDVDVKDDDFAVIALCSAYFGIVFLICLFHQALQIYMDSKVNQETRKYELKCAYKIGFMALIFILGVILGSTISFIAGSVIVILSTYAIFFYLIGIIHSKVSARSRHKAEQKSRTNVDFYLETVVDLYVVLLRLAFTPLLSLWVKTFYFPFTANVSDPILDVGKISGGILVVYVIIFLITSVNPYPIDGDRKINFFDKIFRKMIFFNETNDRARMNLKKHTILRNREFENEHSFGDTRYRVGLWWFDHFLMIETIAIVWMINYDRDFALSSAYYYYNEYYDGTRFDAADTGVKIAVIYSFITAIILILLPYRQTKYNRLEVFPRFANIALGVFAFYHTFSEDEKQSQRLLVGMIITSVLTMFFWLFHLQLFAVFKSLKTEVIRIYNGETGTKESLQENDNI